MRQHVLDLISQDDSKAREPACMCVVTMHHLGALPAWAYGGDGGQRPLHASTHVGCHACAAPLLTYMQLIPPPNPRPGPCRSHRSLCRWRWWLPRSRAATTRASGRGWCLTCWAARTAAARSRCACARTHARAYMRAHEHACMSTHACVRMRAHGAAPRCDAATRTSLCAHVRLAALAMHA